APSSNDRLKGGRAASPSTFNSSSGDTFSANKSGPRMKIIVSRTRRLACALFMLLLWSPLYASTVYDQTPRIAVISAFAPELELLQQQLQGPQRHAANGVEFTTGLLQNQPVVLFLSGISMVNAAMTTQLALDRFHITHIIFSGIAGGVNPDIHLGDVVVAQRWGQYLEVLMAREREPGKFDRSDPEGHPAVGTPFRVMVARRVRLRLSEIPDPHQRFWFDAARRLRETARTLQDVPLSACLSADICLSRQLSVVVGGNG